MSDSPAPGTPTDENVGARKHKAGALDIRNIIGGLIGAYGLILLVMGIFGDQETDKTGGWNANLWAGVALAVVGALFLTWARLKPIMVPETTADTDGPPRATTSPGL